MPWWFWIGWSVPLALWFWRLTFRVIVEDGRGWDYREKRPAALGAEDIVFSAVFATLVFTVFGPCIVVHRAFQAATRTTDWDRAAALLGGESREQKQRRRERDLAEREARIREAERELGIGQ